MNRIVFGIYCREDKDGLFFEVGGKSKRDLWPLIHHFCHPETSVICSDEAKQYVGVEKLFGEGTIHKSTNHSKGEFVDKEDKSNTINDIENQNKHFKASLKRRRPKGSFYQFMAMYFYRRNYLNKLETNGEKIFVFLSDIKKVYPGPGKVCLKLKTMDEITAETEGIQHLMPKVRGEGSKEDDLSVLESEVEELEDSDWDNF